MIEIISIILTLFGTMIAGIKLYLNYKEKHKYDGLIQVD